MISSHNLPKPETPANTIEWSAPEYAHHARTPDWYWGLGLLVVAGAIASFLFGNTLLGILIFVGGLTIALLAARKPRIVHCAITSRGIMIGDETHEWKTLRSFWIDEVGETPVLIIQSGKALAPQIVLRIPKEKAPYIKGYFVERASEQEQSVPLSHTLMEYFRF